ncbi:MAG: fibronectin type III domain-containing protein [Paludibacteraceae bacterium]|nr:fibronectin type III domain-containing protein [Paludibacteraceae bacterium]
MKKHLLLGLLLSLMTVTAYSAKEDLYVLYTGFEDGKLPEGWTLEGVKDGVDVTWSVESASTASHPAGVPKDGGNYRATFGNATGQTQNCSVKLVSPVFSIADVTEPILIFNHAQLQRTGDVDTLKVYYRTAADMEWKCFATYPDAQTPKYTKWTEETLELPARSATFQIAFEGVDNYGWGIALDEIIVRPNPTCWIDNLEATEITVNTATLVWQASLDADSIEVVVATKELDLENPDFGAIVAYGKTDKFSYSLTGLTRNTRYYAYVRSLCSDHETDWIGINFRTKNFASVPYEQKFNLVYASNTVNHMSYMTQGTSITKTDGTMEYMPFVNQMTSDESCKSYSFDSTRCYVFTGARAISTAIPAGEYVYGATPEMNCEDITKLSVTFWGTSERYVGEDYAGGIIVGVMTNPEDFSTFVAVDTCYMTQEYEHNKFVVDLKDYKGYESEGKTTYGKYVAFASNFKDKKNIFYVDNVLVDYTAKVSIPKGITLSNISYNKVTVNVADLGNATAMNIVVSDKFTYNGKKPSSVIIEKTNVSGSSLEIESELLKNKLLYVYVQGINGTDASEYSLPVGMKFQNVIDSIPFELKFDAATINAGSYDYLKDINPLVRTITSRQMFNDVILARGLEANNAAWYYSSEPAIVLRNVGDYLAISALPADFNIKDLFVTFSIAPYYSSATHVDDARVALGVMTDPYDLSTFDSVAVFDGTGTTSPRAQNCAYNFVNYTGSGRYLAFKYVMPKSGNTEENMDIHFINMYNQAGRMRPYDVAVDASTLSANITWKGNAEAKHSISIVKMKPEAYAADNYGTYGIRYIMDKLMADTAVTGLGLDVKLDPHSVYQLSVSVIYDNDTLEGINNFTFMTDCEEKQTIPYVEDFEYYAASAQFKQYPSCWTGSAWKSYNSGGSYSHTEYYPYFSSSSTEGYTHSGKQTMVFGASTTLTTDMWLAMPEFDTEINTLQLRMWIKPAMGGYNDSIDVGLIPKDATDLSAFEHIAYIKVQGTAQYREYITRLSSYEGTSAGKRLCIVKRTAAKHYYYIDDILVEPLSECAKIMDVEFANIGTSGATINWQSETATQWEVLVSKISLDADTLDLLSRTEIDSTIVLSWETVNSKPYVFSSDSAKVNTTYYVYVRGICGTVSGEWSGEASFATMCMAQDIATYTEDFSTAQNIDCWTIGMRNGDIVSTNLKIVNEYFYMFNVASTDGAYAVMPPMDVDDISKWQVSFDAHGGSTAAYLKELTVGVITNASDLTTFEPMTVVKLNQVAATSAATKYGFDEAYRYTVRFSTYEGDWRGNKGNRVMFLSESGDKQNYVYLDNIEFYQIGEVVEPLEVWATETGMDYAVLTWDSVGTKYNIKVSSKKIDPTSEAGDVCDSTVTGNSARIEGLTMLTRYYVYVQTVGEGTSTSLWSNVRWFETICPPSYELPYQNDFSGKVVTTSVPYDGADCWQHYYDGVAIEDYLSGSSFYSRMYASANYAGTVTGDNGLYLGSTLGSTTTNPKSAVAVLPMINADLSKAMLEFDWRSSSTTNSATSPNLRKLAIGIAKVAEPYDSLLATVQYLDTVTTEGYIGTWKHEMLPLSKYAGDGKYVVLTMFGGNDYSASTLAYAYLDNLKIAEAPAVFPPATIACGKTFGSTAELSWTQTLGSYSQWQVVAVKSGEEIPENATVQTFDTTAGVFTGLQGSTEYDFYVRAVDANGNVSPWVATPATGTTLYLVEVKDAFWNFDSQATQEHFNNSTSWKEKGWLQGMIRGSFNNTYVPYLYSNTINSTSKLRTSWYSFSGDTCMRFYSTSTYAGYTVMPQINCNLDSMQLRFKINATYCNENTRAVTTTYAKGTYAHSIKIGYMTDPYDYSTFKEITTYVYPEITATVKIEDDPTGNRFWEEVTVPLYGVGEGKYIVFSNDFNSNQVYVDDVIVEKETGCAMPVQVTLDSLAYNAAKFVWGSSKSAWNVKVINKESGLTEVEKNNLTEMCYVINNLAEQTEYIFIVQAVCGTDEVSDEVQIQFKTPCKPTEESAAYWSFNENLYQYGSSASYLIPECTTVGGNTTTQSNLPYAVKNAPAATGANYARTQDDDDYALRFYTTKTAYNNYIAFPQMGFALDSMTLHFWGRAAYFYKNTHTTAATKERLYAVNSAYSRTLIVGVMTDVEDFETFTPLDTITYDKVWSGTVASVADRYMSDDKTGNNWWQEYALPLAKYAGKGNITIVAPNPADFSSASTPTSYFFVEDLEIVKGSFCTTASNVRVADIQSRQATIAWDLPEGTSDSVGVALYLSVAGKEPTDSLVAQIDAVIPSHEYTFTGLKPGSDYYYAVKHYCSDEDESQWSVIQSFTCNYEAPRFKEDFTTVRTYPVHWTRGGNTSTTASMACTAENVFDGLKIATLTETATSNAAWRRNSGSDGMGGGSIWHSMASNRTGTAAAASYAWLMTPNISLLTSEQNNMMLSFELGMWDIDGGTNLNPLSEDDCFMVIVSTDAGKTWKAENIAASWKTDGTGDYDFNKVGPQRTTYFVDLSKWVGQGIMIAFYSGSKCPGLTPGNKLYLDNVQLNVFEKKEYSSEICKWNDFTDESFNIDAYDLNVNTTTTYTKYVPAEADNQLDSLTILNLTVYCDTTTTFEENICEGEDFKSYGFSIENVTKSNTYKLKLEGENKCDSVVVLNLTVLPKLHNDVEATICQGAYYEFGGKKYYTSTTVEETFTSSLGCDSIVTLHLKVNDVLAGTPEEVYLCSDSIFEWPYSSKFGQITDGGLYIDTIQNSLGCDTVVSVHVTNVASAKTFVRAAICSGGAYDVYPFRGLRDAGDFDSHLETVYGCDSTVTLHLMIAENGVLNDKIGMDELPYVLNGEELYGEGTEEGVYTTTVNLACGEVTLVLTVGTPDGLHSVFANSLALAPNPVRTGETVTVLSSFSAAQVADMTVEVYDGTGALVSRKTPKVAPVTIDPLPAAGVYMVRIVTGGETYQAKLVVK